MSPFRDAVGFVDCEQIHSHTCQERKDAWGEQSFRRDVEKFHFTALHVLHILLIFLRRKRAVEEQGRNAEGA
jgi:hypothetical protein